MKQSWKHKMISNEEHLSVKSKSKMVKSIKEYDDLAAYLLQKNFNLIIRQRVFDGDIQSYRKSTSLVFV